MFCLTIELKKSMDQELWDQISTIVFSNNAKGIDEGEIQPPEGELALHAANEFEHALQPGLLSPPDKFSVYFETLEDLNNAKTNILNLLTAYLPTVDQRKVEDIDYSESWRKNFKPILVGQDWLVRAPWNTKPADTKFSHELIIEPGMAFGTGSHETTKACLELISKAIKENLNTKTVLDFGCGSGILAIALKKLNVSQVYGVDIDPLSVEATKNNAILNSVSVTTSLEFSKLPLKNLDGIVANILKNTLLEFAEYFEKWIKKDGFLILSGLLETQKDEILKKYQSLGFKLIEVLIRADTTPEDLVHKTNESMNWIAIYLKNLNFLTSLQQRI